MHGRGVLVAIGLAVCSEGANASPLTLTECIHRAWLADPRVVAHQGDLREAEAARSIARGAFLPRVDADLGYTRESRQRLQEGLLGSDEFYHAGAFASEMLWDFGSGWSEMRRASAQLVRQAHLLDLTRCAVAEDVADAYYAVLLAREERVLVGESLGLSEQVAATVRERYAAGQVAGDGLLQAEYGARMFRENAADISRREERATRRLQEACGMSLDSPLALAADPREPAVSAQPETVGASNPGVQAEEESVRVAEAELSGAWSGYLPRLEAGASYYRYGTTFFPPDGLLSGRLTLTWSLFSGGSSLARRRALAGARDRAIANRALAEEAVRERNVALHEDAEEARGRWVWNGEFSDRARKALAEARAKYEVGARSLDDLLRTQTTANEIVLGRARARYAWLLADFHLRALAGPEGLVGEGR